MKRTCAQKNANTNKPNTCELHRVRKLNKKIYYHRQRIINLKNLFK
jgi:hypothetical protein